MIRMSSRRRRGPAKHPIIKYLREKLSIETTVRFLPAHRTSVSLFINEQSLHECANLQTYFEL